MTTTSSKPATVDAAAQASIGAAARELHLPTVRSEAARLAEIADRDRHTHLRYLAEVLAAEVDDRTERRRARRINDAKFPRFVGQHQVPWRPRRGRASPRAPRAGSDHAGPGRYGCARVRRG